jgi:hypothetical protein
MLGKGDAYSGDAETENRGGKELAKFHGGFLRRESYAWLKKRVKGNIEDGYASFESWDKQAKLGRSVAESEGQSLGDTDARSDKLRE